MIKSYRKQGKFCEKYVKTFLFSYKQTWHNCDDRYTHTLSVAIKEEDPMWVSTIVQAFLYHIEWMYTIVIQIIL